MTIVRVSADALIRRERLVLPAHGANRSYYRWAGYVVVEGNCIVLLFSGGNFDKCASCTWNVAFNHFSWNMEMKERAGNESTKAGAVILQVILNSGRAEGNHIKQELIHLSKVLGVPLALEGLKITRGNATGGLTFELKDRSINLDALITRQP